MPTPLLYLLALLWSVTLAPVGWAALLGHGGPVKGIAISADGRFAVTAGFDYSVIVWRLADESILRRLLGHDGPVNAVALTSDGVTAASAGDDGSVAVWDVATGTLRRRLRTEAKLGSIAISRDDAVIAAGGWDGLVHRWQLTDGAPLPDLPSGGERVTALAFTAGALLAGGHEGSLRAWRGGSQAPVQSPAHDFAVTGVAVLADGTLLTASTDRTLRRWDAAAMSPIQELAGHEQPVIALAASGDAALFASAGAKGEVLLWRLGEPHPLRALAGSGTPIWSLAFAPGGRHLLGGGADGVVRIWDTATGDQLGRAVPEPERLAAGRGPRLFAKCAACHSLTADGGNKAGPSLAGVLGRRAGTVANYPYSPALRESGVVWTEEAIARLFDLGPDNFLPGTKMPLQRLPNPRDRADLIDYLRHAGGR